MPISALTLAVVGADYPNKRGPSRRMELLICKPGEAVALVPEPKNPEDRYAVMVMSARAVQLGYVTAERAPWISGMLAEGREIKAVFQEATPFGALIRATLDGSEPALPAARPRQRAEAPPDFYPDEIYPDD